MGDRTPSTFGDALSLERRFPLRWYVLDRPLISRELEEAENHNMELLRVVANLDDYAPDLSDEEPVVAHELQRLDFKLNVLLRLVGQVYLRHSPLPPEITARLGAQALEWECADALPEGGIVRLEVYLDQQYPLPLIVFGRIETMTPIPNGYRALASFLEMSETIQEWLQKIIFRHHRRYIANSRRT